jgi:hypothetical protein
LIGNARRFHARGYRHSPGPPEALADTEHNDVVERTELEAMDEATIAARLTRPRPTAAGLAIGFRGPP